MTHKNLEHQLSRVLVISLAVILLVFGIAILIIERGRFYSSIEGVETRVDAIIIPRIATWTQQLFFDNREGIEFSAEQLMTTYGMIGVEIYDRNLSLYYSTVAGSPRYFPDSMPSPGTTRHTYINTFHSQKVLTYAVPLMIVDDLYGFLRIHYDLEPLYNETILAWAMFVLLILSLFFTSITVVSGFLRKMIILPLTTLSHAMKEAQEGFLGIQVQVDSNNELGMIADAFNRMSKENEHLYQTLELDNHELQLTVDEQTEELTRSRLLLERVLDSSLNGIMVLRSVYDQEGTVEDFMWVMVNPAAETICSGSHTIVGHTLLGLQPLLEHSEFVQFLYSAAQSGLSASRQMYIDFTHARGWFHVSAVSIDEGLAVTLHDISEQKVLENDLQRRAYEDGLTGIANRYCFNRYLETIWGICERDNQCVSLLFIDVDYFKLFNDTYGHLAGDEALKAIAEVLKRNASRPRDLCARYGGEEFVLLLPGTDVHGAELVADKVCDEIRCLHIPHEASTASCCVTVSVGIAWCFPSRKVSVTDFVQASDNALYRAKQSGRNTFITHSYQ